MNIKRVEKAVGLMEAVAEELQSELNEFYAQRGDWYDRQLKLRESGQLSEDDFSSSVWNVYKDKLFTSFDADLQSLEVGVKGFVQDYKKFLDARARLDEVLAKEKGV